MTDVPRSGVQSLDRAVSILRTFSVEHPTRGVSEIAREVGLTPSTTHRLLASLGALGMVRRVPNSADYALGPELLRLAYLAHQQMKLAELARPIMINLRNATGETVGLHVVDDTPARIVLDQVESPHALRRTYTEIGEPVAIHEGAPGKVLLAHLPEAVRESVLAEPLSKPTEHTIVDPDRLRTELDAVRKQGYAISVEERVPGISTVAVPIRGYDNLVGASISVSGPSSRMTLARLMDLVPVVQVSARKLSARLGQRMPASLTPEAESQD